MSGHSGIRARRLRQQPTGADRRAPQPSEPVDVDIGGRRLRLTSLDRVLFPETGFTKGELVDYYRRVAPALLPHLRGRAVTLGRWPGGIDTRGFAMTECRGCPDWVRTAPVPLRSGVVRNYCVIDDEATLTWLANLGTIEIHPFLAPADAPDRPDAMVLDLDPGPGAGLEECRTVALRLRELLAERDLTARVKTSGGYGLHVYADAPGTSFAETKATARELAARLAAEQPELVTDETKRSARAGRVLVDWLQNERMRSTVAPYSLRATDRPSVSTPLAWEELEAGAPGTFAPAAALDRVERLGDLF